MQLDIDGVRFGYNSMPVLNGVGLKVNAGEMLGLIGPNGSGKSTLLKCINRILKPQKGSVFIEGRNINQMTLNEMAKCLGYVPQSSPTSFPLTVFEAVLLGRRPHVNWKLGERDKQIVYTILQKMELEDMALRNFNEMSGGEQQKVLMARALSQEPQVLLLDEPTSNLDLKHQLETLDVVTEVVKKNNLVAIMAVHDLNLAARYTDTVVMLKKGKVYAAGSYQETLTAANIREVYGVETEVIGTHDRPYIIPLASVKRKQEIVDMVAV